MASTYENRWVKHGIISMESAEKHEVIYGPPAIFEVPEALRKTKAEAYYTPQLLGLGAYHHLRPEFHRTDTIKRCVAKKFMEANNPSISFQKFIENMKHLEAAVRGSYYKYLDLEASTLQYIMVVDSLFLLSFLKTNNEGGGSILDSKELAKDVLMLENQIPAAALRQIVNELNLFPYSSGDKKLYTEVLYTFCENHSPLKLAFNRHIKSKHLLAHMYHFIVKNGTPHDSKDSLGLPWFQKSGSSLLSSSSQFFRTLSKFVDPAVSPFVAFLNGVIDAVMQKSFKQKAFVRFIDVCNNSIPSLFPEKADEVDDDDELPQIPSVSELSVRFKVDFQLITTGGIRDIEFQEGKKSTTTTTTLHLPNIKLQYDSEVVLRNLVAYEATVAKSSELSDYVDLMRGIVTSSKDVHFLRKKGIITGTLTNEEIAEMFTGITTPSGGASSKQGKSSSQKAMEEVHKMVEKWENENVWKRACKFCTRNAKNAMTFLSVSLGCLAYIHMLALLVMQMFLIYCQLFGGGCNKEGSKRTYIANLISTYMVSYE